MNKGPKGNGTSSSKPFLPSRGHQLLKELVGSEDPAKKIKKEEPDDLFQDAKGKEIRDFVLNIARKHSQNN